MLREFLNFILSVIKGALTTIAVMLYFSFILFISALPIVIAIFIVIWILSR